MNTSKYSIENIKFWFEISVGSWKTSKSKVPLLERCQTIVPYDALIVRIGASLCLLISNKIEPRIREFHCDIRNWDTPWTCCFYRKST